MPGKRVTIDDETWQALDLLARDRMMDFQELADEAFADLLTKHRRPVGLKAALKQSAGTVGSNDNETGRNQPPPPGRKAPSRRPKGTKSGTKS